MRFKQEHSKLNKILFYDDAFNYFDNHRDFIAHYDRFGDIKDFWHRSGLFYVKLNNAIGSVGRYCSISVILDFAYSDGAGNRVQLTRHLVDIHLMGKGDLPDVLTEMGQKAIQEKLDMEEREWRRRQEDMERGWFYADELPF